jgi:hypothetical protein
MLKQDVFRSERLRQAVAAVPCVCCGLWNYTQAAHIGGLAEGKGGALKVPDSHIASLCTLHPGFGPGGSHQLVSGCHELFDLHQIDAARGWEFIAKTYIWLVENGRLKVVK